MVLLKDEYEKEKNAFIARYGEEMKKIIKEDKDSFMKTSMQYVTIGDFIKNYAGAAIFILILSYFAWAKDVISFDVFAVLAIILFIVHVCIFLAWEKDMKYAALREFGTKQYLLISDFVYKKMLDDVSNSIIGVDFEKKVQFYSIAIYDIPRNFYVNVYDL